MDKGGFDDDADFGGFDAEETEPRRDPLEVFDKGLEHYQEKYFRTAYMIAKGAAGLAGINDQIPDMDDLQRTRFYYEEVKRAADTFRAEGLDEKGRRLLV